MSLEGRDVEFAASKTGAFRPRRIEGLLSALTANWQSRPIPVAEQKQIYGVPFSEENVSP